MFELIGQMMRLPFATFAAVLEAVAEAVSSAGRLTDEGVGRVLAPAVRPTSRAGVAGGGEAAGGAGLPEPPAAGDREAIQSGARWGAESKEKENGKMTDTNLSDDSVKLVHYVIVSVDRENERILRLGDKQAEGYRIVTDNLTPESFAAWSIAHYFQQPDHEKLGEEEKKYLRVCYEVRCRWPRESLHYEEKQLDRLEEIKRSIDGLAGSIGRT